MAIVSTCLLWSAVAAIYVHSGYSNMVILFLADPDPNCPLKRDWIGRRTLPNGQKAALYITLGIGVLAWPAIELSSLWLRRTENET